MLSVEPPPEAALLAAAAPSVSCAAPPWFFPLGFAPWVLSSSSQAFPASRS